MNSGRIKLSLYEQIGAPVIARVIRIFYERAFEDPIIQHFFIGFDREALTAAQTDFAQAMLGGPRAYHGKPLAAVHSAFPIRAPHFNRRQVLMKDVLWEVGVDPELARAWLKLEDQLRPLILGEGAASCDARPSHR